MATNIIQNGDVTECWNKPDDAGKPNHWGIYYGGDTTELVSWGSDDVDFVGAPCSAFFSCKTVDYTNYAWINTGLIAANNGGYGTVDASIVYGGQPYQLSFDIKHDFVEGIEVIVIWFDEANTRNFFKIWLSANGNVPPTAGVWLNYSTNITIPTGAKQAVLMFRMYKSYPLGTVRTGTCHLDNVFLGTDYECPSSTACFTHNVNGNMVTFDAACSSGGVTSNGIPHDIKTYNWKFGDLGTGAGKTVAHTYSAPGTYVTELSIINDCEPTPKITTNFITITDMGGGTTEPAATAGQGSNTMLIVGGLVFVGVVVALSLRK